MKFISFKGRLLISFLSLCLFASPVYSQDTRFHKFMLDQAVATDTSTHQFYLVSHRGVLPAACRLVRQLDDKHAIVILQASVPDILKQDNEITLYPANDEWKWSPMFVSSVLQNAASTETYIVSVLDLQTFIKTADKNSITILYKDPLTGSAIIKTSLARLKQLLLPDPNIIFIDKKFVPATEVGIIGYDRSFHGINAIDYSLPGVNGTGIVVGVKEQKMEAQDLDLYKRVLPSALADDNVEMHATVISSIIGGAGNSFYDGRGMAYGCRFFPSSFDNLFADDIQALNNNNVFIQNHSYGTVLQQFYGAEAMSYDASAWQQKNRLHIFSAGNKGLQSATDGPYAGIAGFANLTGNFKMAKNIVAVAAVDNRENIISESSAGPAYDGRMVPQLAALGPNGTSDAAAMVSGAAALIQQVYKDSNANQLPAASLVKALLYNNAEDIGKPGIDHKTGFGLLNALESVKQLQQKHYAISSLANQQQWTQTISIPAGIESFKVTLTWTDTAATLNNTRALQNDLDLSVEKNSNAFIYLPWVLNISPHPDSLNKAAVRGRDSVNTSEQVSIRLPEAGLYTIRVRGTAIQNNAVPFSISYRLDTLNRFYFTSPQHTSDVNRSENPGIFIRWKCAVADTNTTGNLYISYDRGAQWQLLEANYKLYRNKYPWAIKDTNSTALLKMQTGFGDFFSREFFIGAVCRPKVDFYCADSFRLSWPKHLYANGYKIWTLTDSPYLKHILTVSDSFLVLDRSVYPQLVYAVEPVLQNGIPAARSIAMDISLQGVKCFYRTFYHVLRDNNELELNLSLSAPAYADSIYFEQVTSSGLLLRTVGLLKVLPGQSLYQQLVNDLLPGTSHWRAKIKLKTGAILYTDIIEVLTTGNKFLLIYPNPASRQQELKFALKQGYTQGLSLVLYDAMGRSLKQYNELPNSIDVSRVAPGLIFYRLLRNGKTIETGKFILY